MPKVQVAVDPKLSTAFDHAFDQLTQLVEMSGADEFHPTRANAVYTTSVVLWMLVYQRMNSDTTLAAAVKQLLDTRPEFLPDHKRIREGTLSPNSGAYSKARKRVPLEAVRAFANYASRSLIDATTSAFEGRRVFCLMERPSLWLRNQNCSVRFRPRRTSTVKASGRLSRLWWLMN